MPINNISTMVKYEGGGGGGRYKDRSDEPTRGVFLLTILAL